MKNNKNRMRDHDHSSAELRKMKPKENANAGMENGHPIGTHDGEHEKDGRKEGGHAE